jgi:hypothetical protein
LIILIHHNKTVICVWVNDDYMNINLFSETFDLMSAYFLASSVRFLPTVRAMDKQALSSGLPIAWLHTNECITARCCRAGDHPVMLQRTKDWQGAGERPDPDQAISPNQSSATRPQPAAA